MYYLPIACTRYYCSGCCFMSYACGKRYYVCVTCMLWCSDSESVLLLVSNIHDIILVHTHFELVCTSLYSHLFPVPVCTRYVPVCTSSEPVCSKYPVPVNCLTIPEAGTSIFGICLVYTWYIPCICSPIYTWYIHGYTMYIKQV
jgi:hypothetical protein